MPIFINEFLKTFFHWSALIFTDNRLESKFVLFWENILLVFCFFKVIPNQIVDLVKFLDNITSADVEVIVI